MYKQNNNSILSNTGKRVSVRKSIDSIQNNKIKGSFDSNTINSSKKYSVESTFIPLNTILERNIDSNVRIYIYIYLFNNFF